MADFRPKEIRLESKGLKLWSDDFCFGLFQLGQVVLSENDTDRAAGESSAAVVEAKYEKVEFNPGGIQRGRISYLRKVGWDWAGDDEIGGVSAKKQERFLFLSTSTLVLVPQA